MAVLFFGFETCFCRYSDISQFAWFGGKPHWIQVLPGAAVCSERKPLLCSLPAGCDCPSSPSAAGQEGFCQLAYHQVHFKGILYNASVRILFVTNGKPTQTGLKKEDVLGPLTGRSPSVVGGQMQYNQGFSFGSWTSPEMDLS